MGCVKKEKERVNLAEQIRSAFEWSGITRFELSKRSSVSYGIVHRFIGQERNIKLDTASKLCDVLGLELRPLRRRK